VRAGKKVALANKETLVVAGKIISSLAKKSGAALIPVDSEHSAIFQCLAGEEHRSVEQITLTASGGPFLNLPLEKLREVTPKDALRHPNWTMGDKITIDSASMMNKGLEVIEARWLFDIEPERIKALIHPQSVIHSMVHFHDGSVKAQLGVPDMRIPILYALAYPERIESDLPRLDFSACSTFTFFNPDLSRFRNLELAYRAIAAGGNMPCILNAANEVAVRAFLNGSAGFLDMPDIVEHTMTDSGYIADPGLEELEHCDNEARIIAEEYINKHHKKR
jgi:1-deoxy-D-xylulose-5-phosphate reductoisomerase